MTANLKPYPNTTDSGVEWIGEVPSHWEVRRLKRICRLAYGDSLNEETRRVGPVPVFGSNGRVGSHRSANTSAPCIIVGRKGSFGKVNYSRTPVFAIDTTFYVDHRYSSSNIRWLYFLLGWLELDNITRDSAVPGLNRHEAYRRVVPIPPLSEQSAMARFLGQADCRIQRYLRAKHRLIVLLEEMKQAVIDQAVTGQIDVRTGRPYSAYKPSGVPWLGDMPKHWERCRLRNVVSAVTTGSRAWSSYAADAGPLFIRIANLSRGSLKLRFDEVVRLSLPETSEAGRTRVETGDLLISVTAYIGSIGVATDDLEEAYVSQHVARCSPTPESSSRWLGYVLLSTIGRSHGRMSLYGGTKDGLSLDDVRNYPVLLPPRREQEQLVQWIEAKLSSLVAKQDGTRRQIEMVREYRNRLITDVVLGRLDVRQARATLPQGVRGSDA